MWASVRMIRRLGAALVMGAALLGTGCTISEDAAEELNDLADKIIDAVGDIQVVDPRTVDLPPVLDGTSNTVILRNDVTVVNVIQEDLVVQELPNINLLGFENRTGFDIFISYDVEGAPQGVYVLDGETLLLEYDCLSDFELVSEDDVDPDSGVLADSFDFQDALFLNPDDFLCGDAVIVTFAPEDISVTTELIDLTK